MPGQPLNMEIAGPLDAGIGLSTLGGEMCGSEADDDGTPAPLLAVVDPTGQLGGWVTTMCRMLRLRLHIAPDADALARALERHRPMAVLCGDLGGDGRPLTRLLKLMACYDRALPVLLVTGDAPETLGSVDAAIELWPLHDIQRIAGPVRMEAIMQFLARAGRRSGTARMIAI